MKREFIVIAISAILFAGCSSVPSAKNGKHLPADVAGSGVSPVGREVPTAATSVPGAHVSTLDGAADGADLAGGMGAQDLSGIADARNRATAGEAGRRRTFFAAHRATEIENLASSSQP